MNLKMLFGTTFVFMMVFSCNQKKECCKKGAETKGSEATMDESIYNIHSEWKKQDGTKMKLDALEGKIIVAAMVFTHCQSACPRIVSDIQRIEKEVSDVSNLQFLLISMDPTRDTPERFREFGKERQLGPNWTMLSSTQEATDEMANVLGVKIKKLSDGGFDHSNSIFVIDQTGTIAFIQEGLEQEPAETIKRINELNK